MSVPYEEAISNLQQIVPSLDKDIIGIILQSNGGHMEKTVEQLLSMAGEIPEDEVKYDPNQEVKAKQLEEDEKLARALQNELFISQLAATGNSDFDIFTKRPTRRNPSSSLSSSQRKNMAEIEEQDPILEGLKRLGESARLKFRELAQKFERLDQNADNAPSNSYNPLPTEDKAEVITLDTSLAKRNNFFDEQDEEDEFSLTKHKGQTGLIKKNTNSSSSTTSSSTSTKTNNSNNSKTNSTNTNSLKNIKNSPSTSSPKKTSSLLPAKKKAE